MLFTEFKTNSVPGIFAIKFAEMSIFEPKIKQKIFFLIMRGGLMVKILFSFILTYVMALHFPLPITVEMWQPSTLVFAKFEYIGNHVLKKG